MKKSKLLLLVIPLSVLAQNDFVSIEAGKLIEYPDLTLRTERVDTTNLYDIVFYEMKMGLTNRVGTCDKADIEKNGNGILTINFRDVTIEIKNPTGETATIETRVYPIRIETPLHFLNFSGGKTAENGSSCIFVEQQGNLNQPPPLPPSHKATVDKRGRQRGSEEGCFNCGINSVPVFRSNPDDRV